MAEFSTETVPAFDDVAIENDAAAVAGADDGGHGGFTAAGAEDRVVTPKCGGVAVVQIGDGFAEFLGQTVANVEAGPL